MSEKQCKIHVEYSRWCVQKCISGAWFKMLIFYYFQIIFLLIASLQLLVTSIILFSLYKSPNARNNLFYWIVAVRTLLHSFWFAGSYSETCRGT